MIDRISIVDVARRQHSLVTRRQALDAGYSTNQIKERIRRGTWRVTERGIYRLASHPDLWLTAVLAASLRTRGVASHRTAGVLWKLD
ncbi:MAG: type IV toxin-antitoxin system AbiEi family antitoxin domain-containing protein, partial [Acidimicrobiales bacterium]